MMKDPKIHHYSCLRSVKILGTNLNVFVHSATVPDQILVSVYGVSGRPWVSLPVRAANIA